MNDGDGYYKILEINGIYVSDLKYSLRAAFLQQTLQHTNELDL